MKYIPNITKIAAYYHNAMENGEITQDEWIDLIAILTKGAHKDLGNFLENERKKGNLV